MDDRTIQQLNRQYLDHDEPTDVLSFLLEREAERLEGEIVVSRDTAACSAPAYGWTPADELLLYVIHGACTWWVLTTPRRRRPRKCGGKNSVTLNNSVCRRGIDFVPRVAL